MPFAFGGFSIFFYLIYGVVIVVILVALVRRIKTWHTNNNSPRLTVEATVVSKQTNVSHHHYNDGNTGMMHAATGTTYYITFQFASGDRLELQVPRNEYGMIVEGDYGDLSFQGTRYLSFARRSAAGEEN